jgi:8-oxo-dGTP diphosphatase
MIKVVAAYIPSGDKFLITKRAKGELKGLWEFPGGKVEKDESNFAALEREIKEELNIEILPQKELQTFTHNYPFAEIHLNLIHCDLPDNQTITSDGSHTKYLWVTLAETRNKKFAPLDEKIINYLKYINPLSKSV